MSSTLDNLEDELEKLTSRSEMLEELQKLLQLSITHMQMFPTTNIENIQDRFEVLSHRWLMEYSELGTEISQVDRFSCSDLLFVTLCYIRMALHTEERTARHKDDENIEATLEVARFYGVQHTPALMTNNFPTPERLEELFKRVAWIVVFKLSGRVEMSESEKLAYKEGKGRPVTNKLEVERILTLGSWLTDAEKKMRAEMLTFARAPVDDDGKTVRPLELGAFMSEINVNGAFLPQCSRILHGLLLQQHVYKAYPESTYTPIIDSAIRGQFIRWIAKVSRIDSADDFGNDLRNFIYELALPSNARLNARTRRQGGESAEVVALTLLQSECGYDVASAISEAFPQRLRDIGKDEKHPYFQMMVLLMFSYMASHEQRLNILKLFYIKEADLHVRMKKDIEKPTKFGRPRAPLIVRLRRRFVLHYWNKEGIGYWLSCDDAVDACLKWLVLVEEFNEGEPYPGFQISEWIARHLRLQDTILDE